MSLAGCPGDLRSLAGVGETQKNDWIEPSDSSRRHLVRGYYSMEPPSHVASHSRGTTRYWQSLMESYFHPLSSGGEPEFTGLLRFHPSASATTSSSLLTTTAASSRQRSSHTTVCGFREILLLN